MTSYKHYFCNLFGIFNKNHLNNIISQLVNSSNPHYSWLMVTNSPLEIWGKQSYNSLILGKLVIYH